MTNPTPEGEASEKLSRLAVFQILHEHLSQSRPMTPWERKVAAEALWSEFEPAEPPAQSLSKGTTETPERPWAKCCGELEELRITHAALQRENEKLREEVTAQKDIAEYRAETVEEKMKEIVSLRTDLATKDAQMEAMRNSVVEAATALPNVGEYISVLEKQRDDAQQSLARARADAATATATADKFQRELLALRRTTQQ